MNAKKEIPKITYKRKWFNPLFFILEDIVENKPEVKRVLVYGGKSSSKTFSISQLLAKRGLERRDNAIMFRKESTRVKTTIKQSFKAAVETTRLTEGWTTYDRSFKSITGAEVVLTGLDSEDKAKGVEGYSFVLYDELDQFEYAEYNQTNLSLRGEGRKVFFCTWNPVSELSWVKTDLVDRYEWEDTEYKLPSKDSFVRISSCGTTMLIKTVYEDNFWTVGSPCQTYGFRDENLISDYKSLEDRDYNSYRVNVLGEWGIVNTGGEFYKNFDPNTHIIKDANYVSDEPLHISFDENVNPYLACSIWQMKGKSCVKIGEVGLKHPRNTLKHTCKEVLDMYPNHTGGCFVYGDATSRKQDTKLEKGYNFFTLIMDYLQPLHPSLRVPRSNPPVSRRGDFINQILKNELYDISIKISYICKHSIDDFQQVKEDSDGTKLKKKIKDPDTEVRYEQFGHFTDTDDYFLCEAFHTEFTNFLRGGDIIARPVVNTKRKAAY